MTVSPGYIGDHILQFVGPKFMLYDTREFPFEVAPNANRFFHMQPSTLTYDIDL